MKKLLVVSEAGDRWASGVVRALAYRELFANSFATRFETREPLRTMDWINGLPSIWRKVFVRPSARRRLSKLAEMASEQQILRLARDVDIVYLVKIVSFPFVLALCRETNARVVYDFCDAVWLREKTPDAFHEVLRTVDAVTTDNELTAGYVRPFNTNCTVIPDAPALEEFDKRREELGKKANDPIVLGWIGSKATAFNLYVIWEALEELFSRYSHLHLRLVGTGNDSRLIPKFEKVRFSYRPSYKQTEMIEEIFGMHIGLFPLQDIERCRMRGVLKATNYMCGEAAVVTSPVGKCVDVIQDGVNGMIAGSTQEWIDKLELLISDAKLRRRLTQNGLETVRSSFRLDQSFAKLKEVLLAESGSIQN